MRLRNNCFVSLFILFDDIKVEQYTKNDDEDESKMKYLVYKQKLKPFRIFFYHPINNFFAVFLMYNDNSVVGLIQTFHKNSYII